MISLPYLINFSLGDWSGDGHTIHFAGYDNKRRHLGYQVMAYLNKDRYILFLLLTVGHTFALILAILDFKYTQLIINNAEVLKYFIHMSIIVILLFSSLFVYTYNLVHRNKY